MTRLHRANPFAMGWTACRWIALLALVGTGCDRGPETDAIPVTPAFQFAPTGLDSERAFKEVERFVALGPRDAGTEGARKAADHLAARLVEHGVKAVVESFEEPAPRGPTTFRNVVGTLDGTTPQRIILGSHYDTKYDVGQGFEGANDSGSSTGLLLELARALAEQAADDYRGPEIQFAFFDGEEARVRYGPNDGFHGSRHHASKLVESGEHDDVLAVVILDMVGDKDLSVTLPRNSSPHLRQIVLEAAHLEGVRTRFALSPYTIGDDHEAFMERGMPAIDIIDFHYGSRPGRNDYWHTPADRMDKISAESLGIVGRVTIRVINRLLRDAAQF